MNQNNSKSNNSHAFMSMNKENIQTSSATENKPGAEDPSFDINIIHESSDSNLLFNSSSFPPSSCNLTPFSSIELNQCPEDILSKCCVQSQYDNLRPSLFNHHFTLSESSKPMSSTTNSAKVHNNDIFQEVKKEDIQSMSNHLNDSSDNKDPIIIDDSLQITSTTDSLTINTSSSIFGVKSTPSDSCPEDDLLSRCWFQSQYDNACPSLFDPLILQEGEKLSENTTNSSMMDFLNSDVSSEVKQEDTQSYSSFSSDNSNENYISIINSVCESPCASSSEIPISSQLFYDAFPPPPYDTSQSISSCNHHSFPSAEDSLSECCSQNQDNIFWPSSFDQYTFSDNTKPIHTVDNVIMNSNDNTLYQEVKKENSQSNLNNSNNLKDEDPHCVNIPTDTSSTIPTSIPITVTPISSSIIFDIHPCETFCHHHHTHCYKREYLENPLTKCHFHSQCEMPCLVHSDLSTQSENSKPIRIQINNWFVQGKIKKF